jgi:hypothetical protein
MRLLMAVSRLSNHSHMRPLPSALRTFNTQRPWTQSASAMQTGSWSRIDPDTYSHSIVN